MKILEKAKSNETVCKIAAFLDGTYYPLALAGVLLAFYMLSLPIVGLAVGLACLGFICLFCEDTRPALATVLLAAFGMQYKYGAAAYYSGGAIVVYVLFGLPALFALVYRFVAFERVREKRPLTVGFLAFGFALFASGWFSEYYSLLSFLYGLMQAGSFLFVYLYFSRTMKHREDNFLYLARLFAVAIGLISVEIGFLYATKYTAGTPLDWRWKDEVILGWGISNMVGEMLATLLPALFYLIYKEKRGYLYYILVFVCLVAIYFTFGRGALGCAAIVTAAGVTVNCFVGKNRLINLILVGAGVAGVAAVAVFLLVTGRMSGLLTFFTSVGLDDRGRVEMWANHVWLFTESPIFGSGFMAYRQLDLGPQLNAHNTLLQMLSSAGLIGLGCYLYHRVQTIALFVKKPKLDRLFMGACILTGLVASLIGPLVFRFYFAFYYSAILLVVEKSVIAENHEARAKRVSSVSKKK